MIGTPSQPLMKITCLIFTFDTQNRNIKVVLQVMGKTAKIRLHSIKILPPKWSSLLAF